MGPAFRGGPFLIGGFMRSLIVKDSSTGDVICVLSEDDVAELLGYYIGIQEFEAWLEEGDA